MRRSAIVAAALAAVCLTSHVWGQSSEAVDRTKDAARLIQEGRYQAALRELELALEEAPDYWEAHYQRGRALGLSGDMSAALPSLLRATELNPGMAHAHELVAVAAWANDDADLGWEHIVRAYHGGGSVEELIRSTAQRIAPPDDLLERLAAPRVFVDDFDLRELESRAELPFNRNPLARDDESRSGVPADIQGRERALEAGAELLSVHRQFRSSLLDSRAYGLVLDPRLAEYALRIQIDELGERPPRSLSGYIELVAMQSGMVGYRTPLRLRQIEARGELHGQIELIVDELEAWLRQLRSQ